MLPIRLRLQNFTSYVDQEVDFSGVRCAALVGHNGAGKSSLLDAVTWALFGEGTKGGPRALDNYVRRGETEAVVAVEFILHGHTYRVERARNVARQRSTLRLLELTGLGTWQEIGGKAVAETQAAIERLLRMDYRTFTASSLILQGKADTLTADMTDHERKDILTRILGLDLWDRLLEAARERLSQAKAQVEITCQQLAATEHEAGQCGELQGQLDEIETSLAALATQIADLEAEAETLRAQVAQRPAIETRLQELTTASSRARHDQIEAQQHIVQAEQEMAQRTALLGQRAEILAAVAQVEQLAPMVARHDEAAQHVLRLTREIERVSGTLVELERSVASETARLESALTTARGQAALLDDVPCAGTDLQPRCRLLANARQAAATIEATAQKVDTLRGKDRTAGPRTTLEDLRHQRQRITYDDAAHRRDRGALEQARLLARRQADLDAAEQRVRELTEQTTAARDHVKTAQERLRELAAADTSTREALRALQPLQGRLGELTGALTQSRSLDARARETLGGLRQSLERATAAAARVGDLRAAAAAAQGTIRTWELVAEASSKRGGVPALIVETAVPEIERLTNQLLDRMTGGRLRVRLETQQETKAGTLAEVLRIIVLDQGSERPYQTYSGAERFMADLALRVALAKFLAHRAGAEIQLLVLDEGIAAADVENRQRIVEVIEGMQADFGMILIISHLEELKERFPQRVEITRDGGGSTVRVLA